LFNLLRGGLHVQSAPNCTIKLLYLSNRFQIATQRNFLCSPKRSRIIKN
jgi:hypothetical protein